MQEPRSFESSLWDIISVALGTNTNIDAAFDTKVQSRIGNQLARLVSQRFMQRSFALLLPLP